jgi:hypothetical protein
MVSFVSGKKQARDKPNCIIIITLLSRLVIAMHKYINP